MLLPRLLSLLDTSHRHGLAGDETEEVDPDFILTPFLRRLVKKEKGRPKIVYTL